MKQCPTLLRLKRRYGSGQKIEKRSFIMDFEVYNERAKES